MILKSPILPTLLFLSQISREETLILEDGGRILCLRDGHRGTKRGGSQGAHGQRIRRLLGESWLVVAYTNQTQDDNQQGIDVVAMMVLDIIKSWMGQERVDIGPSGK